MNASGCRWKATQKLSRRDLLLVTCLAYIKISVASSFSFFIYNLFIPICFGFDETKLTKGKLYREIPPVPKYNFKERFFECADKYGHVGSAD